MLGHQVKVVMEFIDDLFGLFSKDITLPSPPARMRPGPRAGGYSGIDMLV
jgi:hypothetical protein